MRNKNREKFFSRIFFIVLFLLYSGLTMAFFYRQAIPADGVFYSDMEAYILETQGLESGYEFPYRLFFWIARICTLFFSPAVAVAFTTMLCNSTAVLLTKYYFDREINKYIKKEGLQDDTVWDVLSTLSVFVLFFVSMVYSPRGTAFFGFDYTYRCQGILTPNPYWNATFLAVRPLTIAVFFTGVELLKNYRETLSQKSIIIFGILVFLCTFTKPSFTFILLPVGTVVLLWRLYRSRGRFWKNTLILCVSLIPTGFLLLYEFFGVFAGNTVASKEQGIGIGLFKAWHVFSDNIPLSVVMAAAFPIAVLILNAKELRREEGFRLAWQLWLAGFLTFALCYEKGFRFEHMNFSWGYMHGLFFVFMVSILEVIKNIMQKKAGVKRLGTVLEVGLLAFHLVCGVVFFIYLYQGNNMAWF